MGREISQLKRKLTNLSSANPLLWMGRLRAGIHVDVCRLLFDTAVPSDEFLNQLSSGKRRIKLSPVFNPRNPSENKTGAQLHRLAKFRELEKQERGTDHLFLAWPFAGGQWPDGSPVRTPFQLIPCTLHNDGKYWILEPRPEDAFLNPAFMLAYAHHCGKPLEETLFEKSLDINASDAREYLTVFYEKVRDSLLEINFNSDLFSLNLQEFQVERKPDFGFGGPGILRLLPQAVLGLFPLSDSVLLPDFEELEKQFDQLEDLFTGSSDERHPPLESDLIFPLPVDGSQEACLRRILAGESLLVQGPPGSGKSQLITNLAASAAASGKSVLIVCQKRVALEVVFRRLEQLGIARHAAMWADYRNDLSHLYACIAKQIDDLEETESRNKALNTVILERDFQRTCREITRICQNLEEWKEAVFDHRLAGISYHELKSLASGSTEKEDYAGFLKLCYSDFQDLLDWYFRFGNEMADCRPRGTLAASRGIWSPDQVPSILAELDASISELDLLHSFISELGASSGSEMNILKKLSARAVMLPELYQALSGLDATAVLSPGFRKNVIQKAPKIKELKILLKSWPLSLRCRQQELNQVLALQAANFGAGRFVIRMKSLFSSELRTLHYWLTELENAGFSDPKAALAAAGNLENLCKNDPLFANASVFALETDGIETWLEDIPSFMDELAKQAGFMEEVQEHLPAAVFTDLSSLQRLSGKLREGQQKLDHIYTIFQRYFPWEHPEVCREKLSREWAHIKDAVIQIQRADGILLSLPVHWPDIILSLLARPEKMMDDFRADWAACWKANLESRFPVLRGKKKWFQAEIRLLQKSIREKQVLAQDIIRLKLEEETHRNLERNRLQNRTTYRGLYHQVTRKRQRVPLRSLWNAHGNEIQKLIPVWLATPESVSATWPLHMKFDLVIFDEASQCFAEKGLPAIARGRQVLILGDGKQLPPNHLFSARWEEEDNPDELLFSEQDSLLDLARQFFPAQMLSGHYRSRYPELIAFSNQHFYEGKLQIFPAAETLLPRVPAIRFVQVDGSWENRCNQTESEWIAENAIRFFGENPDSSLGVICFNAAQQERIEQDIYRKSVESGLIVPESFFVKNIENVQGDERDYIWFSLGYAANASGNLISQFGSLSQDGGENRLNVAVTRARLGITLVSSLSPQQWQFAARLARGPSLLAAYVQFAGEVASQPKLSGDFAMGSIRSYCDAMAGSTLSLHNIGKVYEADSMKVHFGLNPLMNLAAGYETEFHYWED